MLAESRCASEHSPERSPMGIARAITRIPGFLVFLIVVACIGLSVFGLDAWMTPKIRQGVDFVINNYDAHVPEVSLRGGKAFIKKEQPYYVDLGPASQDVVVVIDTRPGHEKDALEYLKDAKAGFVLSRENFVTKSNREIRMIPLKGFPNVDINSRTMRLLFDRYFPWCRVAVAVSLAFWYGFTKVTQMLLLALIPLAWTRGTRPDIGYGACVKLAAVGMVPLVFLDLVLNLADVHVPGGFLVHWAVYLALYIVLMVLASLDLVSASRKTTDPMAAIQP
jgi:hypothetical protein